jgi:sulfofructose kinase
MAEGNAPAARILCVGALTMDTIYRMPALPDGPGKFLPLDAMEIAEGMAASAAASIARLGGAVSLLTAVGDDAVGARLLAAMAAEAVDCALVRPTRGVPSGISTVLVDPAGERLIVPFYHPRLWGEPRVPAGIAGGEFAAVLVDVRWPDAAAPILAAAAAAGVPGILDADVGAPEALERLAPLASHIVASRPGARLLTGSDQPEVAAEALFRRFGAMTVVTAGEAGCFWIDANGVGVHRQAAFRVEAVDTTAAGDVFHGAFALGVARGWDDAKIVRFASAAAAVKCTRFGGRLGAPTLKETEALLGVRG